MQIAQNKYFSVNGTNNKLCTNRNNILTFQAKGKQAQEKDMVFIAMPIKRTQPEGYNWTSAVNEQIKIIADKCGYKAVRVDDESIDLKITDRIFKLIDKCKIMIADLTEANPNVYLEVGYALAKGKSVIPIVQGVHDLKFDVKDMDTVVYHDWEQLDKGLTKRLEQT